MAPHGKYDSRAEELVKLVAGRCDASTNAKVRGARGIDAYTHEGDKGVVDAILFMTSGYEPVGAAEVAGSDAVGPKLGDCARTDLNYFRGRREFRCDGTNYHREYTIGHGIIANGGPVEHRLADT